MAHLVSLLIRVRCPPTSLKTEFLTQVAALAGGDDQLSAATPRTAATAMALACMRNLPNSAYRTAFNAAARSKQPRVKQNSVRALQLRNLLAVRNLSSEELKMQGNRNRTDRNFS